MRFHSPSFLHYLEFGLPLDVAFMHHRNTVYVLAKAPLRVEFLQELVAETVQRSILEPVGTLTQTEERSLFSTPPEPHVEALCQALLKDREYIRKTQVKRGEGGGEGTRYEYQIDLAAVNRIVQRVRLEEDARLVRSLIAGDAFTSIRIARKKVNLAIGRDFSKVRLEKALKHLEMLGVLARPKKNRLQSIGREVVA